MFQLESQSKRSNRRDGPNSSIECQQKCSEPPMPVAILQRLDIPQTDQAHASGLRESKAIANTMDLPERLLPRVARPGQRQNDLMLLSCMLKVGKKPFVEESSLWQPDFRFHLKMRPASIQASSHPREFRAWRFAPVASACSV